MIGIPAASTFENIATLAPVSVPSRTTSVSVTAATPARRRRSNASATASSVVSTHPLIAILPSRTSTEPKTLPGNSPHASTINSGLRNAAEPIRNDIGARCERLAYRDYRTESAAYVEAASDRRANRAHRLKIAWRASNGAVEIHDVDEFRALFLESA
jgi:hypothetical protein